VAWLERTSRVASPPALRMPKLVGAPRRSSGWQEFSSRRALPVAAEPRWDLVMWELAGNGAAVA
jgi:hypothetical protein